MKTTIPVFSCGYCGNMDVKHDDVRCSACGGRFDWDNTVQENVEIKSEKQVVFIDKAKNKVVERTGIVSQENVFIDIPTWSAETLEKKPVRCPCNETTTPFTEQQRMNETGQQAYRRKMREALDEKRRNMYKTERIVIIGVGTIFDMMKNEKYRKGHPNTTSMYSGNLIWIRADGKDFEPHVTWVWNKDKEAVEKYAQYIFKVMLADVEEYTGPDGLIRYNVARHVLKHEHEMSIDEIEGAMGKIPKKFTIDSIDNLVGKMDDTNADRALKKWCTFDGLVLSKRLYEFGSVMNILIDSDDFTSKPLRTHVPKMFDTMLIGDGDVVKVNGYWYMNRKFDPEQKRIVETTEPIVHASSIVVLDKVPKADKEILDDLK